MAPTILSRLRAHHQCPKSETPRFEQLRQTGTYRAFTCQDCGARVILRNASVLQDRGAVLIQVAIVMFGLLAFSAIVIDYGIMWTARAQTQNAADAAALTAALSLTYDNTTLANVKAKARAVGLANPVWGAAPDIQIADIQLVNCPPTLNWPITDICVKADAYRNQGRNNALPTVFGRLIGINAQGVRATATARAVGSATASCLKPWVVGDKWFDTQPGGWTTTSTYDPTAGDYYTPPNPGPPLNPGTGFSAKDAAGNPTYYGYQMMLKLANPGQGQNQVPINSAGWAMEVCLENTAEPGNPCGTPAYTGNISGCTTEEVTISPFGGTCPDPPGADPTKGCLAVKPGGTGGNNHSAILEYIEDHDPTAYWTNGGGGTSWQTGTITTTQSPSSRIAPVAIFSVPEYLANPANNGSNGIVRIVNLVGFFIEGTCFENFYKEPYLNCPTGGQAKTAIVGRLVNFQGTRAGGPVTGNFGQILTLVR